MVPDAGVHGLAAPMDVLWQTASNFAMKAPRSIGPVSVRATAEACGNSNSVLSAAG
jgi:hypothetical protein